jgi:hypothetical protein
MRPGRVRQAGLRSSPSIGRRHLARSALRLQVARLARIIPDLVAQAGDLHVQRAFLCQLALVLALVAAQVLDQLSRG